MSECESKISTDHLILKEPCKAEFAFDVSHQVWVTGAKYPIVVTTKYEVKIEPIGFALGRHLYSLPLTPGEEVEIEVFRRAKVERELSQQSSTEVEFIGEFMETFRDEWSKKTTTNTKRGGGVSVDLDFTDLDVGLHSEPEYSYAETNFTDLFAEVIVKAKRRVDQKFDIHIDLKTEVENKYRSTRKIKNPNTCQTVTYNYFQLMRKYKITATRTNLLLDYTPTPPRTLTTYIPAVIRSYAMPPPELTTLMPTMEEKSQPAETPSPGVTPAVAVPVSSAPTPAEAIPAERATISMYKATVGVETSVPAAKTLLHPIIEEPHVLELSKDMLLSKMDKQAVFKDTVERKELSEFIDRLYSKFLLGKVVTEKEICINTNSMHVEPMLGLCLACDKHTVEMRELELERAKVELEKARQEIKEVSPLPEQPSLAPQPPLTALCPFCGARLAPDAVYCDRCKRRVKS